MTAGNPASSGQQFRDAVKAMFSDESTGAALVDKVLGTVRWRVVLPITSGATVDQNFNFEILDRQVQITSVKITTGQTITHDGTNNRTYTLKYDDGANGAATTIATLDTSAADWTANVPNVLAITAANAVVPAGKQLRLESVHNNNGVVSPVSVLLVDAVLL